MRRLLTLAAIGLLTALLPLGVAQAAPGDPFQSCAQAAAAGYSNIPRGSFGYSSALDRDGDGVACEAAGSSQGAGISTGSAAQPASVAGTVAGQVAVVPEGGAPTGDGSTEANPTAVLGGSVAAVAAAGLAGALVVRGLRGRRGRPASTR